MTEGNGSLTHLHIGAAWPVLWRLYLEIKHMMLMEPMTIWFLSFYTCIYVIYQSIGRSPDHTLFSSSWQNNYSIIVLFTLVNIIVENQAERYTTHMQNKQKPLIPTIAIHEINLYQGNFLSYLVGDILRMTRIESVLFDRTFYAYSSHFRENKIYCG